MAKITFSKLALKKKNEVVSITYNDSTIEVKQYLPIEDKLTIIFNAINNAVDQNNFMNPIKLTYYGQLELIFNYTNISFTEKQMEEQTKIYDLLSENGLLEQILDAIPESEVAFILNGIDDCAACIYEYNNSALGILESINKNYENLKFETDDIEEKLSNPNNLKLVKDIVTKLG